MTQSDNISIIDMDKETDVQKSIKTKQKYSSIVKQLESEPRAWVLCTEASSSVGKRPNSWEITCPPPHLPC